VDPTLLTNLLLFAEGEPAPGPNMFSLLMPFLLIGVVFYFLLIRPQRNERKQRQEMLSRVKKNDRVVTIGGIYGLVANVHPEADEVIIKVDETTNTKLRVTLGSIARVLKDETSEDKSK